MTIDWTFSIGNLVQLAGFLVMAVALFYGLKGDIRVIRHDMRHMEQRQEALGEAVKQLGQVLQQVAVQDTRISMIEKTVDELRHGHGFVRGLLPFGLKPDAGGGR